MDDWGGSTTSGGGLQQVQPIGPKKFPLRAQLSILSVVVLTVGIFASVIASQQSTENRSRASGTTEIIMDNGDATAVGDWATGTSAPGHYGSDYRFEGAGNGSSYMQYRPNITTAGTYSVYEWHSQGTNRTTAANIIVTYNGGSKTVLVNQQTNGGQWYFLGTFDFAQGTSGSVKLNNNFPGTADTVIIADAVKFVYTGVVAAPTSAPVPTSTPFPTPTPLPVPTHVVTFPTPTNMPTLTPTPILPTNTPIPTSVPAASATLLNLSLALHGLGNGGDSININAIGNLLPINPQKMVTIEIYNSQNQLIATKQGLVTLDPLTGKFVGKIDLGSQVPSGNYTIKVKLAQYLRTLLPGIQTITTGQVNSLPQATLIAGDINGDNTINILDYNILMGCYSDLLPASNCTPENAIAADLTDDGHVNQFDYNFFLRELSTRQGN